MARGDLEGAWREALRGVELVRRGRAPTEVAFSVLVQGEVALARGDTEAAAAGARDARVLLGSAPDPGHLTERLLALEEALPRSAPAPAGGEGELTDRELAVLRRLAGLESAREIACGALRLPQHDQDPDPLHLPQAGRGDAGRGRGARAGARAAEPLPRPPRAQLNTT